MRSFWTGDVALGHVLIPIKLYSATTEAEPTTVMVHKECSTKIIQVRRCPKCEKDLAWEDIGKGIEVSKDKHALLSEEELAKLEGGRDTRIHVLSVVPTTLDLMRVDKTYWALPGSKDKRSYILLRDALSLSGRAACVSVALRTRPRTAVLAVHGDAMTLTMLRAPSEVLQHTENGLKATPYSVKELRLAKKLIESLKGDIVESEAPLKQTREKVIEEAVAKNSESLEALLESSLPETTKRRERAR